MHAPESASLGSGLDEVHSQEPPPEDENECIDRISSLSDVILGETVSLLPTKEGARTQILSKRWCPVWCFAPLNVDLFDHSTDCDAFTNVVSCIVSIHKGPGKRFRVPSYYHHHYPHIVDAWLQSSALNNLQEIDIYSSSNRLPLNAPPPPLAFIFHLSSCLRVATLHYCSILDNNSEMLHFPQLKKLALSFVNISEGSLHSLIAGCPALECLLLDCSHFFRCVRINSDSLISIGVYGNYRCGGLEEIIIENTPSLQKFIYFQWDLGLRVSIISAPKLETLGCLLHSDNSSRIQFGTTVIQGLDVISSKTVMNTISILAVNMQSLPGYNY